MTAEKAGKEWAHLQGRALGFSSLCECGECLLAQGALLGRDWLGLGMEWLVWRGTNEEEHPETAEPKGPLVANYKWEAGVKKNEEN